MTWAITLFALLATFTSAVPRPDLRQIAQDAEAELDADDKPLTVAAPERPAGVPVDVPQDLPAKIQACSDLLAKDPPAPCVPPPPADTCKPVQTQARWRLVPSGQWPAIKDDLKPESAITAIDRTLRYWKARGGQCAQIGTHRLVKAEQLAAGLAQLRELISAMRDPSELAKQIDLRFEVYESLPDAAPQGQITGYFAPDIPLRTTGGPGKVPVLGRPKDLVRNPDPNACPRFGRMENDRFGRE